MRFSRRGRATALAVVALALVGLLSVTPLRDVGLRAADRSAVAASETVAAQREAAERAIARGHAKAADQIRRARELRLPISDDEAVRIVDRGLEALAAIRRDALAALAAAGGLRGPDVAPYVLDAERRIEGKDFDQDPGVLLAPTLYAVVARANELFAQAADGATRELTRPRSPSPSPARPSLTASPTGR